MNIRVAEQMNTLLFDFDDTLFRGLGLTYDTFSTVFQERDMPMPDFQAFAGMYYGTLEETIDRVAGGGLSRRDRKSIMRRFVYIDNESVVDVDKHLYEDAVRLSKRVHEQTNGTVQQLVVTSRYHGKDRGNGSPRTMIEKSCLRDIIKHVICGDDSEYRKPHKQVLGSWLPHIGSVAVVGDQVDDVELADALDGVGLLVRRNELPIGRQERLLSLMMRGRTHVVRSLDNVVFDTSFPAAPIPQTRRSVEEPTARVL